MMPIYDSGKFTKIFEDNRYKKKKKSKRVRVEKMFK